MWHSWEYVVPLSDAYEKAQGRNMCFVLGKALAASKPMSNPGFIKLNEDYLEVQLSKKNLSNQTLLLRIGQLEEYLEREGSCNRFKIDLDFRDNPKVTDTDLEFDGFGRLVTFLKKFGSFVTRLRIGGTGISGNGLCELIDFIKMGAAEELDFSNLPGVEQAMSGDVEPSASCEMINLNVLCLNGEGCKLTLPPSTLGREVRQMVLEQLPPKRGGRLALQYRASPLVLGQTLQEQGIEGQDVTLSCTYVPTDMCAAWRYASGYIQGVEEESALEGLTEMIGAIDGEYLRHLPSSLENLTFGLRFNQGLKGVTFPSSLQSLTFGDFFDQSLGGVTFPSSLQDLTFGAAFNQSLEGVIFPSSLQNLTFGTQFNQSLERVTFPKSLHSLTFGDFFDQSLEGVIFPSSLQSLTFGDFFDQSLEGVLFPSSLQSLKFGDVFNQSLKGVTFPSSLQNLTLGTRFNQSLKGVTFPSNLQSLTCGTQFNHSLEGVTFPSSLQDVTFGARFNHSLGGVTFPGSLQSLTFGGEFNQGLEGVSFPSSVQILTFGTQFSQSLEAVTFPSSLEDLTFGSQFNQSLEGVTFPSSLQDLTFGAAFNQSLDGVIFPSSLQNLTFGYFFDQSLEGVTFPRSLHSLTFGHFFDQSLEGVIFPSSLQSLTFGTQFNQSLKGVTFPGNLQSLTLGDFFAQSLEGVTFPSSLQSFTFSTKFNHSLEGVTFPSSLQDLTFGAAFNQSLEGVIFPSSLQNLTFGHFFDQSLEGVTFPRSLQSLTFGHFFDQSLEGVIFPSSLQSLKFGDVFNESLEGVTFPSSLQSLTFGHFFDQSLEGVIFPSSLQSLTFGTQFNQSLEGVTFPSRVIFPSSLQSLTFGHFFDQSLEGVIFPSSLQSLKFGDDVNQSLDGVTFPSGFHNDLVVALLTAVKESEQYPLQKSLPLLFRLDRNGLEKPHEIIALVSQDLCCEVLTDPCELQKAEAARQKVHRGEAEATEVMISLPEFYLQEELVTTPAPKTPPSPPSTPEKPLKPLNLKAKAQPPPPPPPVMEEVKVEEEDEDVPIVGSLPKAFRGSSAKKASPVGVSILPLANPKPPDHEPPAHVLWNNMKNSAKARQWMEGEIQKSVMTKAWSRCESKALAQGVPETMPIYGIGAPPPNERPKPTKSMALASPLPPPLAPPWSGWLRESQEKTPVIPANARPAQKRPTEEKTSISPGTPSAKSNVVQVLTQVAVGGKMISQAAQSDALRMLEKFSKSSTSDVIPKPTSSEVRTLPSPQQKQVASQGSQEWNHSEGKEEWKDWSERKWSDWSGVPWRAWEQDQQDQAWNQWDVKNEATWDAKKEATWDATKETTWDVKQEATWVKQDNTWDFKQESTCTWDVKQESTWDVKQESLWDVKKESMWDVTKETTWDVKKETTWNVKQETKWDVKEWSWTGQYLKDENIQAQSWNHTEVKAEEWKDWSEWKGDWQNWEKEPTWKTWLPEEKEWTRGWFDEKASEEQDSEWKERKSHHQPDEKPSIEKPSTTEVELNMEVEEDEPSQRIGHFAEMLERWKEKREQLEQDMKKSREELKQELSLQQDACRDNSEDPSDVETETFPRVPAPQPAYEAYESAYELVEEEELEEPEAMDVDEVVKRSREVLRKARGEVPSHRKGKRGRSPLPKEPPYPPPNPKKARTSGRRGSLRSGPSRRKGKKGGVDDSKACAVDIRDLLYSQKSCKDTFQCGRSVDQLVKDLETGKVDVSAPFLRLTVFETRDEKSRKPELRCIDNRRLLALKEYAKKIGNPKLRVNISLFSEETLTQVQRFFQNSDDTDGRDVRLRTSRNDKRRQLVD
eukprot:s77_g17.t2